MDHSQYPTKVQRVLRAIEGAERPWTDVQVEVRADERVAGQPCGTQYIIRATRPGNVFVAQTLQLFVSTTWWPWSNRTTQRGVQGTVYRFGGDVAVRSERDLYRISY